MKKKYWRVFRIQNAEVTGWLKLDEQGLHRWTDRGTSTKFRSSHRAYGIARELNHQATMSAYGVQICEPRGAE